MPFKRLKFASYFSEPALYLFFSSFSNTEYRVLLFVAERVHRNANADVGRSSKMLRNAANVWRETGGYHRGRKLMNACSLLKIELLRSNKDAV